MELSDYVSVYEAAQLINRKESLIRTLCQNGRLAGVTKFGKSWLIPRNSILNYTPAKRGVKPITARRSQDQELIATTLATLQEQENNNEIS